MIRIIILAKQQKLRVLGKASGSQKTMIAVASWVGWPEVTNVIAGGSRNSSKVKLICKAAPEK